MCSMYIEHDSGRGTEHGNIYRCIRRTYFRSRKQVLEQEICLGFRVDATRVHLKPVPRLRTKKCIVYPLFSPHLSNSSHSVNVIRYTPRLTFPIRDVFFLVLPTVAVVALSPILLEVAALVSSVAGGIAATTWFLYRATALGHTTQKPDATLNPFIGVDASNRHPSWSGPWHTNDESDLHPRDENLHQGEGDIMSKEGNVEGMAGGSEGEGADGGKSGEVNHEWPVFGSNWIGGRFGAF